MSKSKSASARLRRRVAIASGVATVAALGVMTPAYAEAKLTLSSASGPSGLANAITATSPTAVFAGITPVVQFVTTGATGTALCPTSYSLPVERVINGTGGQTAGIVGVPAANVRKVTESKIVITTPTTALNPGGGGAAEFNATGLALVATGVGQTTAKYNVCVYAGTTPGNVATSGLLASGTYTIAARPTIESITPESGPSLGNQKVTITGTGFTTGTTASIGGSALTGVTVNATGTQITATTPARAAGADLKLIINATGGSVDSTTDAQTDDDYSYLNGITVQPNTNAGATTATLDIMGVGFSTYNWVTPTTSLDATPHIFLVEGAYNPAISAAQTTAGDSDERTNGPVAECTDVLLIGDTELVCTLDLTKSINPVDGAVQNVAVPDGAYVVTVVNSGAEGTAPAFQSKVTSGSIFTVAAY